MEKKKKRSLDSGEKEGRRKGSIASSKALVSPETVKLTVLGNKGKKKESQDVSKKRHL